MELTIDCRAGLDAVHDQLARELNFPHWYGRNLDALYDCLTELEQPACFTVLNPDLEPMLLRVLTDAAGENPKLHLHIAL